MAMPPEGTFATLVSPAGYLYVAAETKAAKVYELRESDRAFAPGAPVPREAILVLLSSEGGAYVSFRSLVAEYKVLQGSKDKGAPAKFANYNFAQWEEWSVLPSSTPGYLAFTNRKFAHHVFEAAVHALPDPGTAAAPPPAPQMTAEHRAELEAASKKVAELSRELESSKAKVKSLQEESSKAKQAATQAEEKLQRALKSEQPDASKQLADQEAAWSARVDTLEQTLKQRAASLQEQTAAAKELRAQLATLQQSLQAAELARDKAQAAEKEALKLKLAAERERELTLANGAVSPGTKAGASPASASSDQKRQAEAAEQKRQAEAAERSLREAREAQASLQRQLEAAQGQLGGLQGQLASAAQREAALDKATKEASRRAEEADARARAAEDRAAKAAASQQAANQQAANHQSASREREREDAALRAELAQARAELAQACGELAEARAGGQKRLEELGRERDELAQRAQHLAQAEAAAWAAMGDERRRSEWLEDQLKLHKADKERLDKSEMRQLEEARAAEARAREAAQLASAQAAQMQQQSAALEVELEHVRQFAEHMGTKASEAEGNAAAVMARLSELQVEKEQAEANLGFMVDSLQARLRELESSMREATQQQHALIANREAERQQHQREVHMLQERLASLAEGHSHPQGPQHHGGEPLDPEGGAVAGDGAGGKKSYRDLALEGELGELRAKAAELSSLKQRHGELEAHVRSLESRSAQSFARPDKEEELRARVQALEAQLLPLQSVSWELEQTKSALEQAVASEQKKSEIVSGAQKHAAELANELALTKEETQQLREEYDRLYAQLQAKGDHMEALAADLNAQVCSLVAGIDQSLKEAEAANARRSVGRDASEALDEAGRKESAALEADAAPGSLSAARPKSKRRSKNKAGGKHDASGDASNSTASAMPSALEEASDDMVGKGGGAVGSQGATPATSQEPPPQEGQLRSRGKKDKKKDATAARVTPQGPPASAGDKSGRKRGAAGNHFMRHKGKAWWDPEALLALVKGRELVAASVGLSLLLLLIILWALR
eukprot:jgi/Mesvir1/21355/Mv25125-RA.1